jgi:colanic acid biosynthesis protein WcaH
MYTPKQDYLNVIKNNQLIALDLIIINQKNEVLLGYRNNNPAKNTWFTFGSRVFKEELFEDACERISSNELGLSIKLKDCIKHGVYHHNYTNNFDNDDFGTNYIVFAFVYKINENIIESINGDNQHNMYKWFSVENIKNEDCVHEYVKNYFIENPPNLIF